MFYNGKFDYNIYKFMKSSVKCIKEKVPKYRPLREYVSINYVS